MARFARPLPTGFTLVEILAALAILVLGMSGIFAVLYGGFRHGQQTTAQSAAAILMPEALDAIQRRHLIVNPTPGMPPEAKGQYVETLKNAPFSDSDALYQAYLGDAKPADLTAYNLNEWPPRPQKPRYLGGASGAEGLSLRFRYRLEKHEDWWPHDKDGTYHTENSNSVYRGMYVLTVLAYHDPGGAMQRPQTVHYPVVSLLRWARED
jgi:prepilin-type N-terminal cleavage/methylation domain-containing protein